MNGPQDTATLRAPESEGPPAAPAGRRGVYPPQPVWRVALLLLATCSLYACVWAFRAARDMRDGAGFAYRPWLWMLSPPIGLVSAVSGAIFASDLRRWRERTGARASRAAGPVAVFAALLGMHLLVELAASDITPLWTVFALPFWAFPYLLLHRQLNLVKAGLPDTAFRSSSLRYTRPQLAALAVGALVTVPLAGYVALDTWQRAGSDALAAGTTLEDAAGRFTVSVRGEEWRRIDPGYLNEDSEMEFLGPGEESWALVHVHEGSSLSDTVEFRREAISESYRKSDCSEKRALVEGRMQVVATLECDNRGARGEFAFYAARFVARNDDTVELLAYATTTSSSRHERLKRLASEFSEGLAVE